jgi:hypothetical protein
LLFGVPPVRVAKQEHKGPTVNARRLGHSTSVQVGGSFRVEAWRQGGVNDCRPASMNQERAICSFFVHCVDSACFPSLMPAKPEESPDMLGWMWCESAHPTEVSWLRSKTCSAHPTKRHSRAAPRQPHRSQTHRRPQLRQQLHPRPTPPQTSRFSKALSPSGVDRECISAAPMPMRCTICSPR